MLPKIGYPDHWRDYGALKISRDDLLGNVVRANEFEYRRNLAKLGKPVDHSEWRMRPQTINAYYNPTRNEITFPAAILQPPFFDARGRRCGELWRHRRRHRPRDEPRIR